MCWLLTKWGWTAWCCNPLFSTISWLASAKWRRQKLLRSQSTIFCSWRSWRAALVSPPGATSQVCFWTNKTNGIESMEEVRATIKDIIQYRSLSGKFSSVHSDLAAEGITRWGRKVPFFFSEKKIQIFETLSGFEMARTSDHRFDLFSFGHRFCFWVVCLICLACIKQPDKLTA